jgi:hypothetical protein
MTQRLLNLKTKSLTLQAATFRAKYEASYIKQKFLICNGRSQWSHGLRRGSAAAHLLGLWVRIPPENGCLSLVSVVCCQVEVSATGWSLVQRCPTECGVSKLWSWSLEKIRRPRPPRGCWDIEKQYNDNM